MPAPRSIFALCSVLLAWPALAQAPADPPAPTTPTTPTTPTADAQSLAGPSVARETIGPTLVTKNFRGEFQRLQEPPEEAALRLLRLSPDEERETTRIIHERTALLDGIIAENIPTVLRLQGFAEGGPTPDRLAAIRDLAQSLGPLRARGSLRQELAGVLAEDNRREFGRLLDHYWQELIDSEVTKARRGRAPRRDPAGNNQGGGRSTDEAMMDDLADSMMGERARTGEAMDDAASAREPMMNDRALRQSIAAREALQALGSEVRRSVERRIADGQARLEDALQAIEATPEQAEKIRARALRFAQDSLGGKPTPAQTRAYARDILRELTPAQRRTLLRHNLGK